MASINKYYRYWRNIFIPMAIIIFTVLCLFIGIIPTFRKVQQLYIGIKAVNQEIAKTKTRVELLESLDEADIDNKQKILLSAIPYNKDVPTFMLSLEAVIAEAQITENSFKMEAVGDIASDSAAASNVNNVITAKIAINGPVENMVNFLNKIWQVRRLMRINKADITFDPSSDQVTSSLVVDAFFAALPKTLGRPSDSLEPLTANEEELLVKLNSYPDLTTQYLREPVFIPGNKADPFTPFGITPDLFQSGQATQSSGL